MYGPQIFGSGILSSTGVPLKLSLLATLASGNHAYIKLSFHGSHSTRTDHHVLWSLNWIPAKTFEKDVQDKTKQTQEIQGQQQQYYMLMIISLMEPQSISVEGWEQLRHECAKSKLGGSVWARWNRVWLQYRSSSLIWWAASSSGGSHYDSESVSS